MWVGHNGGVYRQKKGQAPIHFIDVDTVAKIRDLADFERDLLAQKRGGN